MEELYEVKIEGKKRNAPAFTLTLITDIHLPPASEKFKTYLLD